jgi:hypothetical protein
MVNEKIIDYLNKKKAHGYKEEEVRNMAIRHGFDSKEIDEAFDHLSSPEPVKQPEKVEYPSPELEPTPEHVQEKPIEHELKHETFEEHKHISPEEAGLEPDPLKFPKHIPITIFTILIIIGAVAAFVFLRPVCGNGAIEMGETAETCCIDAGCLGDQTCDGNICLDPICGECQYIDMHSCINYECCNKSACPDSKICENNVCIDIPCGECAYAVNYTCVNYECCNDTDCNSTQVCTDNKCIIPQECGECGYLENETCESYVCCEDEYCDDSNPTTSDICLNPGTMNASCTNIEKQSCQTDEECDDGNASTIDICMGGTYCSIILVTECKDGDGACPALCDYTDDNDCERGKVQCTGINCFINQVEDDCNPSNLTYKFSTVDSGIEYDFEAYYELRGMEGNDCLFYTLYIDVDLDYTSTLVQQKLDANMTMQQIEDEIDDLEDDLEDDYEGMDKLCEYPLDDLEDVLRDMKDDDYLVPSYEDSRYDCVGSFY